MFDLSLSQFVWYESYLFFFSGCTVGRRSRSPSPSEVRATRRRQIASQQNDDDYDKGNIPTAIFSNS